MATKKAKNTATAANTPLIYVTRDIERALGRMPGDSYFILANSTPYAESIRTQYPDNVFLIEERAESGELLDTFGLLKAGGKIIEEIMEKSGKKEKKAPQIVVFKNTARIEEFCAQKKWKLLNPAATLAEKIENKITQVKWLGETAKYLPPHAVMKTSEIKLKGGPVPAPFMIQWGHGHTGDGTIFVGADKTGEKMLAALSEKFPNREARVTSFIKGPVFTSNVCVFPDGVVVGNISEQITGMLPFTDNPWSTVGNDWSVPHSFLSEEMIAAIREIGETVGKRMIDSGWLGLFGIDCMYDAERGNIHLIEVNARQPASTTYESQLQEKLRTLAPEHFKDNLTIFEAHLAALQKEKTSGKNAEKNDIKLIEIDDGAQIILRVPEMKELRKTVAEIAEISASLRAKNYTVIEYPNTKPGSDLLRIQSDHGFMESQNKFNRRGKEILETVTGVESEM